MNSEQNVFLDFDEFRIDVLKRQLLCGGEVLPLTSKAFSTLWILIERRGEVVSKEDLMNAVWSDTAVEENNLTQQISTLRKTLGENTRAPRFIITIPGQGYSFVAPVKEISEVEEPAQRLEICKTVEIEKTSKNFVPAFVFSPPLQSLGKAFLIILATAALLPVLFISGFTDSKSAICILPFKSLDKNEKSGIYSEAIPSYVTAKIGNLPNMIVRPANASSEFFGQEQNVLAVGRDNNVDAVLTGSTLCEGENVQIIVHLWDVKNKRQIWAKVFREPVSNAVNAQEAISEEIVSVLRDELTN